MDKYKTVQSVFPDLVGDSHRFKTSKGEISLIFPCMATFDMYEIYSIYGDLFDERERYNSFNDAMRRISNLLQIKCSSCIKCGGTL